MGEVMKHLERFEIPDGNKYLKLINLCCESCNNEIHRTPYEFNKIVGTFLNCDWCSKPISIA